MNVRTKMLAGFVTIALGSVLVGTIGMFSLLEIKASNGRSYNQGTVALAILLDINQGLSDIKVSIRDAGLAKSLKDEKAAQEAVALFTKGRDEFKKSVDSYKSTLATQDDRDSYDTLLKVTVPYLGLIDRVFAMAKDSSFTTRQFLDFLSSTELVAARTSFLAEVEKIQKHDLDAVDANNKAGTILVNNSFALIAIIALLGLVGSIFLGAFLSHSIVQPLLKSVAMAKSVALGDLTQTLSQAILTRSDEVGALGLSLETMRTGLLATVKVLGDSSELLKSGARTLSASTEETSASVTQIAATIESAKHQVQNQSASVVETTATINQIVKSLDSLQNQIEEQAKGVSESAAAVNQMVANIRSVTRIVEHQEGVFKTLISASDNGKVQLSQVGELVKSISTKSETLVEANAIIANIASQTNLLSMNAAIEAAHAGEAGRGFAVVADEIRKLAELATRQSKEISRDITTVRKEIEVVVSSTGTAERSFAEIQEFLFTVNELEQQIKRAMEEQSEGSQQTLDSLNQINQVTQSVRLASQEITTGSKMIGQEMAELLMVSQNLNQGMEEISQGAHEIDAASRQVSETALTTVEQANNLSREVGRFRIA